MVRTDSSRCSNAYVYARTNPGPSSSPSIAASHFSTGHVGSLACRDSSRDYRFAIYAHVVRTDTKEYEKNVVAHTTTPTTRSARASLLFLLRHMLTARLRGTFLFFARCFTPGEKIASHFAPLSPLHRESRRTVFAHVAFLPDENERPRLPAHESRTDPPRVDESPNMIRHPAVALLARTREQPRNEYIDPPSEDTYDKIHGIPRRPNISRRCPVKHLRGEIAALR